MPLPFHTHRIEVLEQTADYGEGEPYSGDTPEDREVAATNVRAIISMPRSGVELMHGGEQSTVYQNFQCDEVPLSHRSWVRDMDADIVYEVVHATHRSVMGLRWVEGQLRKTEGLP